MLLHEDSNGGGRVRFEISDGFADKRPSHAARRKIKSVLFSSKEIKQNKSS